MSSSYLSQEEIDALLRQQPGGAAGQGAGLTETESDTLGEIGNISMGSAATVLSQLLNQRVTITTPRVSVSTLTTLFSAFEAPYVVVEVDFIDGLKGSNLLIINERDAAIIADIMMGGNGLNPPAKLTELHLSAVAEAMNQMIGSAATSMSTMFGRGIGISPPIVSPVDFESSSYVSPLINGEDIVVIRFRIEIGALIDSEIMQVIPVKVAKEEVKLLLYPPAPEQISPPVRAEQAPQPVSSMEHLPVQAVNHQPLPPETKNLELILDVPLSVTVILARTRRQIKEVLGLVPGAILEMDKLADEPVDILVNGTLIAQGEVVVIEENFGVRITSILSPVERLHNLKN
ncbi:MAG: flagellar motor switch phosphatase FliY [Syntrophomonadaceae bacterium]|nr:flagellar motor switch phosphatase FliY [Syntrophomonadaceae bacterium]